MSLLERFEDLYGALTEGLSWYNDKGSYRFVALCALPGSEDPRQTAQRIRSFGDEILSKQSWFGELRSQMRMVVGGLLQGHGDTTEQFLDEVDRVRAMCREHNLRRGGVYECMAILVMRLQRQLQAITEDDVRRLGHIYDAMKSHHWWLTGPEDLPSCGLLVDWPGTPEEIGAYAERIYRGLREAGFSFGDSLQHAAHFLTLSRIEPDTAVRRFSELASRFRMQDVSIWSSDYDELALLSFLEQDPDSLVEKVLSYRERVTLLRPKPNRVTSFGIACDLVFLEALGETNGIGQGLGDLKPLLGLQEVLQAQQAAAAAAAS